MQQSPHPKNPGRRRPGRNATPQKSYASENDAAGYRMHSDSPCTPQKSAAGLQTAQSQQQQQVQSANQKPRNRNSSAKKPRNKDRQSPPLPNGNNNAMSMAFAGASFTSSPAPNALPMPSFLARTASAPDSPGLKVPPPGPSQEPSPPTTDSEGGSTGSPTPPIPRNDESPLEFFFRAQRAEKERTRRASSANAAGTSPMPFSPPHDRAEVCNTVPRAGVPNQPRRPDLVRNPSSGIPSSELDGTPGKAFGPSFSTPYSERIRAARSQNNSVHATPLAARSADLDRSEALKQYLFGGMKTGHPQAQQYASPPSAYSQHPRGMMPATAHSSNSSTGLQPVQMPQSGSADDQAEQLRKMEEKIRQVLKLGPSA